MEIAQKTTQQPSETCDLSSSPMAQAQARPRRCPSSAVRRSCPRPVPVPAPMPSASQIYELAVEPSSFTA